MAAVTPIETPPTPEVREFYERIERSSRGLGVLNVFKVMAHSPELMEAWWRMMALLAAIVRRGFPGGVAVAFVTRPTATGA